MNLVDIIYSKGVTLSEFLEFVKEDSSHFDLIRPYLLQIVWEPFDRNFNDAEVIKYETLNRHILFDVYNKLSEYELLTLVDNRFPSSSVLNYFYQNNHVFDLDTLKKVSIKNPEFKELLFCSDYLKFENLNSFKEYFKDELMPYPEFDDNMFEFRTRRAITTLVNKNIVQNVMRYKEDLNVTIVLNIIDIIELNLREYFTTYNRKTLKSIIEFIDILLSNKEFTKTHIINFTGESALLYEMASNELIEVKKSLEESLIKKEDLEAFNNCNLFGEDVFSLLI